MDRSTLDSGIADLVAQLDALAGMDTSAVLYGSAARGDWVPGRSDVNVMLVLDDPSPPALRRLTPAVTECWHNHGFTPPLIIGRKEWKRARPMSSRSRSPTCNSPTASCAAAIRWPA